VWIREACFSVLPFDIVSDSLSQDVWRKSSQVLGEQLGVQVRPGDTSHLLVLGQGCTNMRHATLQTIAEKSCREECRCAR
jgi:hypothetical protein